MSPDVRRDVPGAGPPTVDVDGPGPADGRPGGWSDDGRGGPPTTRRDGSERAATARLLLPPDDVGAVLRAYRRAAVVLDLAAALVASTLALTFRFGDQTRPGYVLVTLCVPVLWLTVLGLHRTYELRFMGTGTEEYRRVVEGAFILFTVLAVTSYVTRAELSRGYVLLAVPTTVTLTLVARHVLRGRLYRLRLTGLGRQRVLVVGRADAVLSVVQTFEKEPQHGLVAVGACIPEVPGLSVSHVRGVPVVGDPACVLDAVDELGVHVVAVVSHPDLSGAVLRRLAWQLEERDVELVVSPGIVEVAGPRLSIRPVAGLSLLHLERPAITGGRRVLKAVTDRLLGVLALVAAAPLMAVVAVAVRTTSPGPVLFRQTRVGAEGREFTMYKFRSMVADAEQRRSALSDLDEGNGVLFKVRRDPRVTRVGALIRRFSLDELPQLLNVVRGDMSLVGPRPPLPAEVALYDSDATRRLRVRPGLTGLWQVSGRSDLTWEESLRLDLRYVDNWSPMLDLTILWRTARAVVSGTGAY